MQANKRCLITGASGAVGPSVVAAFCSAGYTVSIYNRKRPGRGVFPPGVRVHLGDVTDFDPVSRAVAGVDVVVHLASLLHINDPTSEQFDEIQRVNVTGTSHVTEASRIAGVKRLVLGSSIAVYGYGQGRILTEASPTLPDTVYGRTKLAAEEVALGASNSSGMALSTVLRLAAVYGPRIKGNYQTLLRALEKGRFVPIGSGNNRRTLVHSKDVARAILLAAEHERSAGSIYNVTDGESPRLRVVLEAMCEALERTYPRLAVPRIVARSAATAIDSVGQLAGKRPGVSRLIDKYLEEVVVDGGKFQRELGFNPSLDLESGWRQTVGELRARGEL